MQRMEDRLQQFQQDQGVYASRINNEMSEMLSRIAAIESTIRDREEAIRNAFDATAAQRASELAAVVSDAKSEFDTQRQQLQTITSAVQVEFT